MCGLAGMVHFVDKGMDDVNIKQSLKNLFYRGPDYSGVYQNKNILLAHTRLAIIDTGDEANQPFKDEHDNYILIYNGEIFNYKELRNNLISQDVRFKTNSDTEVLFYLLIKEGKNCLNKLNGFFSFVFYDKSKNYLLIARDRFGEKPLVYYCDDEILAFSSELKGLMPLIGKKNINEDALQFYFELNYIPAPLTIYKDVFKLQPGHFIEVYDNKINGAQPYFKNDIKTTNINYTDAQKKLKELLYDSVKLRMVADVPMGGFLSGGIDSTIACGIAYDINKHFETFTIGFKNQFYFDESADAKKAANYLGIKHHIINSDMTDYRKTIENMCAYLDEPFADSSCIPLYLLCNKAKNKITVALTGDGADELFAGYNKHSALLRSIKNNLTNKILKKTGNFLSILKENRNNKLNNTIRQVKKYASGLNKEFIDRYYDWACFTNSNNVNEMLKKNTQKNKHKITRKYLNELTPADFNSVLLADQQLVLANDMLFKTDMMSMANSMELRPVFLDYRIVNFANSLPAEYKINNRTRKKILRDTFTEYFDPDLLNKPKKGFEAPLHYILTELVKKELLHLLDRKKIIEQGIFNEINISQIRNDLEKNKIKNESTLWAMYVFQKWYYQNIADA